MVFILEEVTDISMGMEVDSVDKFEDILCLDPSRSIRGARRWTRSPRQRSSSLPGASFPAPSPPGRGPG